MSVEEEPSDMESSDKSTMKGIDMNADRSFTHREGDMANNRHDHRCPCCNSDQKRVETITLSDGRHAERHVTEDENGNEIVEVFAEERRPLKLEERIVREHKRVVAKETHEKIRDGEIAQVEVRAFEADVPLQVRERIGLADHAKIVDGDYVRKDEIGQLVADGVVAGVEALMESMGPVVHEKQPEAQQPFFSAQSIVEKNVAEKKKSDTVVNVILAAILVGQLAFFGYIWLAM